MVKKQPGKNSGNGFFTKANAIKNTFTIKGI